VPFFLEFQARQVNDERVRLKLPGIAECPANDSFKKAFVQLIRAAAESFIANPKELAYVTKDQFRTYLGKDASQVDRLSSPGGNERNNFDGLLIYDGEEKEGASITYTQVFRNGAIEAVDARMLIDSRGTKNHIPSVKFEKELVQTTGRFLKAFLAFEIPPPIALALTLTGVKSFIMGVKPSLQRPQLIDRDTLLIPEIIIDDLNTKPEILLQPVLDIVWQSTGWEGSPYYDEQGNWNPS